MQPGEETPDGLPIVRPVDLTTRVFGLASLKRIDPGRAAPYRRTTLAGDELLLCVRGSTGEMAVASPELEDANVTRGIVPIRFQPSLLDAEFGYDLFRSDHLQDQVRAGAHGAALMQINIRVLQKLRLTFPPLPDQRPLVTMLASAELDCERLAAICQQKLAALDALKRSLLHQAFSGQLTEGLLVETAIAEGAA